MKINGKYILRREYMFIIDSTQFSYEIICLFLEEGTDSTLQNNWKLVLGFTKWVYFSNFITVLSENNLHIIHGPLSKSKFVLVNLEGSP